MDPHLDADRGLCAGHGAEAQRVALPVPEPVPGGGRGPRRGAQLLPAALPLDQGAPPLRPPVLSAQPVVVLVSSVDGASNESQSQFQSLYGASDLKFAANATPSSRAVPLFLRNCCCRRFSRSAVPHALTRLLSCSGLGFESLQVPGAVQCSSKCPAKVAAV